VQILRGKYFWGLEVTGHKSRIDMRGVKFLFSLGIFVFVLLLGITKSTLAASKIKEPNVAGSFYPEIPQLLSTMIDEFLSAANPKELDGDIFALVCPHAGYGFSGPTAAFGYKLVQGRTYNTVIVIGPSHQYGFTGVSIYPEGWFRTPLGDIEIDSNFTQLLLDKNIEISFRPPAFSKEHSVEVQLPFLQKVLAGATAFTPEGFKKSYSWKLVPVVMGDCTFKMCQEFAELLSQAIGQRKDVLVVASTDLYHGYDYEELEKIDSQTLDYLKNMDAEGLYYALREGKAQACGGFPVVTTILLAKLKGHQKLEVLAHTNSAQVTGKKTKGIWTVGYVSCAIDQNKKEGAKMLDKQKRKKLLEIARKSIETYLATGTRLELKEDDPELTRIQGAFVTLHKYGQLRGCIGNIIGQKPLYLTVRDMAVEAAVDDPRFPALVSSELKDVDIEISVLSPLEKVDSIDKIELGRHGVMVRRGFNSGVFLPQVATETGWSKEEFLSYLCQHKAGLPATAWKDKATELYIFTAEVFSEKDY